MRVCLSTWMWVGEMKGQNVLKLTFFLSLVSGERPGLNYFFLQYHQSDSAATYCTFFSSFYCSQVISWYYPLLLLLSKRCAWPKKKKKGLRFSSYFLPPFSLSPITQFFYVFALRVWCCWWTTEMPLIPSTVWVRAWTRG